MKLHSAYRPSTIACGLLVSFLHLAICETQIFAQSNAREAQIADYAKKLMSERDKNGNKMIDGDELQTLKGPAASADANNDKVVTLDELTNKLAGTTSAKSPASAERSTGDSRSTPSASGSSDRSSRDGDDDRDRGRDRGWGRGNGDRGRDDDSRGDSRSSSAKSKRVLTWSGDAKSGSDSKSKRRTYRFTPATERLPLGLPSWFKQQDKNKDGQVSMSEYSRTWSKSTVAKFREYDLDDDGIVTAKEAEKKSSKK